MITRRALLALLARSADRALRAGHLVTQRQAAAARQAVRPAVPRPLHRRRQAGRPARSRSSTAASTRKSYIVEVVGCGVAFLDYDNDGWLDIFVLNGTRLEGAPRGRDQSAVQEQPRRHVHRRHREGRPDAHRLGVGGHRRRLRQRRLRRPVHHLLGPQRALSQQRRRHVHRRHRKGRPAADGRALWVRLHLGRLRPRRPPRSVRRQLSRTPRSRSCRSPARTATATGRACR